MWRPWGCFIPLIPVKRSPPWRETFPPTRGMRAVKYGVTRDYVRGLEIVLADGQVMTVGSKNVKDASGLPLKQLFIGAEGTLGVITKCVLRLVPKPEKSLSVLVPYGELKTGIASVHAVLMADANPTAVEFIERSVVELGERYTGVHFPCPQAQAYLLLTFDGHGETVEKNAQRVRQVVQDNGALDYIELTDLPWRRTFGGSAAAL